MLITVSLNRFIAYLSMAFASGYAASLFPPLH